MNPLNDQQRKAAQAPDGPVAVIAGPGTGKTKTLVERIQYLVSNNVAAERILALTFTKKAAEQMADRLQKSCNKGVQVTTFHALCHTLLKEVIGNPPAFIAEPARLALIKQLPRPAAFSGMQVRELSLVISRTKNQADCSPDAKKITALYNRHLAERNLSDFDDLLVQVRNQLRDNPTWRSQVASRFGHILIDEFQDTNSLQYDLLNYLRGHDNVFVIGDPQQSIYGFRGASGDVFTRFIKDHSNTYVVTLTTNYRSTRSVVTLANALYLSQPKLEPNMAAAGAVQAIEVLNEYSEAAWVVARIQQAIGGSDLLNAVSNEHTTAATSLSDFAVLYRSRSVARVVQKMLSESGIPMQIVGDGSPYDEPQVQFVVQLLAKIANPQRDIAIANMSQNQIEALIGMIKAEQSPLAVAQQIIERFKCEQSVHLQHLLGVLVRFKTVAEASLYFDDIASHGFYDSRAEAVTLLTIHAAKGLEFNHVLLVGAEQNVLPSKCGEAQEERRLFFVAVTRAKQYLDILHAQYRGGKKANMSQFIAELPATIMPKITDVALAADKRRQQKRRAKQAQTMLF